MCAIEADEKMLGPKDGKGVLPTMPYLVANYPIGSGVAKGAFRHLVKNGTERPRMWRSVV